MDYSDWSSDLLERINNARTALSLPELYLIEEKEDFKYDSPTEVTFEGTGEGELESIDVVKAELDTVLGPEGDGAKRNQLMNKFATHADVMFSEVDGSIIVTVLVYCHHLILDNVGPFIGGDLVVQGTSAGSQYGPAFCSVLYAADVTDDFREILLVEPWKFILTPGDAKWLIPISVGSDFEDGYVKVRLFIAETASIPYEEEGPFDFNTSGGGGSDVHCAVAFDSRITKGDSSGGGGEGAVEGEEAELELLDLAANRRRDSGGGGGDVAIGEEGMDMQLPSSYRSGEGFAGSESASRDLVKEIRIAFDYDDVIALQSEGFDLTCVSLTPEGPLTEQDHLWKFHVLASYAPPEELEVGVEDVCWIKCLKSLGTLPAMPLFEILHDFDLSDPEDPYSIYIAVKMGPNPRFRRMTMLSTMIENEDLLTRYLNTAQGQFRPAPSEIGKTLGGPCGLFFALEGSAAAAAGQSSAAGSDKFASPTSPVDHTGGGGVGEELSRITPTSPVGGAGGSDNEEEDSEDDEDYEDEEDLVAGLMQQISELESEKQSLTSLNLELQKKSVALLMREKSMQGQAAARVGTEGGGAAAAGGAAGEVIDAVTNEQNLEKDKQYHDTLHLIVDDRVKLNEQLKEFDQLALDLQTRLDDKELKFNGIDQSFKKFKKEILLKAENSRTGHTISKKQIKQFETAEQKREEELEKVRLRNISLRTTFRKLERTLRAREQLAEGLHMIDFEQLKIENQTLNEKIEERNEELGKLKRKKTTTVQVLTHVREKLRFVEQANKVVQVELSALENRTTGLRNIVTSDKLQRDSVRGENSELKARQGFASSDLLLVDYEARRSKVEQLRASIAEYKDRYNILMKQVQVAQSRSTTTPWNLMSSTSQK